MAEDPTVLREDVRVYGADLFVLFEDPLALGLLAIGRENMARRRAAPAGEIMPISLTDLSRSAGIDVRDLQAALWRLTCGQARWSEFNPQHAFIA